MPVTAEPEETGRGIVGWNLYRFESVVLDFRANASARVVVDDLVVGNSSCTEFGWLQGSTDEHADVFKDFASLGVTECLEGVAPPSLFLFFLIS